MNHSRLSGVVYYSVLILGLAFMAPVLASTPDGDTPAQENVCDILQADGITPGLYGLCVAYCEAHDAELLDPETACSMAESRILANYDRKKTATDPGMPCLHEPCLCWDSADLASFYSGERISCEVDKNLGEECDYIRLRTHDDTGAGVSALVSDTSRTGLGYCQFNDNPKVKFATVEQQQACIDALEEIRSVFNPKCKIRPVVCKK